MEKLSNPTKAADPNNTFASFKKLIRVIEKDPVIKNKIIIMLKRDPYNRRIVLNNWLEQLRKQQASKDLINALSCFFDDDIAKEVSTLINNSFS